MKRQVSFLPAGADEGTVEALFYAAPVGFALLDRELRIRMLNGPMRSFLGEGADVGGPLGATRAGAALAPLCRGVIESDDPASQALFTERRRYHVVAYPVASPGFTGVGAMIADVKSPGGCPMDAQKSESLARLAAGIAHHFNNLLTGIMGGASLAMDRLPSGHPARSAVEIVVDSSKRAAELTHQLLAYSGGAPCRCTSIDLKRTIRSACDEMRVVLPKQVRLELEPSDGLPRMKMEETGVQEALKALILNAAEAIGDHAGVIRVAAREADLDERARGFDCSIGELHSGRYLELHVSDDGCGMDAETKTKMFEPFFSTKLFGRGIGLATVQNLVRVHRGCVRVESEPGRGTAISVFLRPVRMLE